MATLPRYPFTENGSSVLLPLHEMSAGQYLQSPDKRFRLDVQADGNLVIYDGATAVWVATAGQPFTSSGKQIDKSKIELPIHPFGWTDPKNAAVELGYAIYAKGSLNNGNVDIKEIMTYLESSFNIDLGDYYRTYLSLK
ncbi:MAG: RteC domain-containing protein, partial [Pseudomonas sp.]